MRENSNKKGFLLEDIIIKPLDVVSNLIPDIFEAVAISLKCRNAVSPTGRRIITSRGSPSSYFCGLVAQAGAVGFTTAHYSENTYLVASAIIASFIAPPLVRMYRGRKDKLFE